MDVNQSPELPLGSAPSATANALDTVVGSAPSATANARDVAGTLSFRRLMGVSIGARLLVDTGVQTFHPFLAVIAGGLGLDIITLGRLLSAQNLVGLVSPLLGQMAEQRGYRLVMRLSLASGALGFLLIGVSQRLVLALFGMVFIGLCLAGFVPTLMAYLSARLPYAIRARGLGVLEYSWALSGIVGVAAVGQVIAWAGWRMPFFLLSGGLAMMAVLFGSLPATHRVETPGVSPPVEAASWSRRVRNFLALGPNAGSAYAGILAGVLNLIALMQFNFAYGAWLTSEYGVGPAQLGFVALVLGCFDLCASVSVSLFTDRFGKRRSVLLGATGGVIGYMALPWFDSGFASAVAAFAITRSFCEFFVVSMFSLLSEQAPTQRAKVLTINAAAMQIGFAVAGFSGPWLYANYRVSGLAFCSTFVLLAAAACVLLWVREVTPDAAAALAPCEQ